MYANTALKADYLLPRFLTDRAVPYRSLPRAVRKQTFIEKQRSPIVLLAKEEWCCDRATD